MSDKVKIEIINGKVTIKSRPHFPTKANKHLKHGVANGNFRHVLHWAEHIRAGLAQQLNALDEKEQSKFIDQLMLNNKIDIKQDTSLQDKITMVCKELFLNPQNLVWGDSHDNQGIERARVFLDRNKQAFLAGKPESFTTYDTEYQDTVGQVDILLRSMANIDDKDTKQKLFEDIRDSVTLDIANKNTKRQDNEMGLLRMKYLIIAQNNPGTQKGQEAFMHAVSQDNPPAINKEPDRKNVDQQNRSLEEISITQSPTPNIKNKDTSINKKI